MKRDENLTPNFKLSEFVREQDSLPPKEILTNLKALAGRLEGVRKLFGKPIKITSGYRTAAHQLELYEQGLTDVKTGGYHTKGMAADIVVVGVPPYEVQQTLKGWLGGMGSYDTFTHLDIRPYTARWHR